MGLRFDDSEIRFMTMLSAGLIFIGPLILALILDRVALSKPFSYGNILRMLLTVCTLLCALFYALLLLLPYDGNQKGVVRLHEFTFACDLNGAHIFQERCGNQKTCKEAEERQGMLNLTNCVYTCQKPMHYENLHRPLNSEPEKAKTAIQQSTTPQSDVYSDDYLESDAEPDAVPPAELTVPRIFIEPPHVCQTSDLNSDATGNYLCHAYTENSHFLAMRVQADTQFKDEDDSYKADWCRYGLGKFPRAPLVDHPFDLLSLCSRLPVPHPRGAGQLDEADQERHQLPAHGRVQRDERLRQQQLPLGRCLRGGGAAQHRVALLHTALPRRPLRHLCSFAGQCGRDCSYKGNVDGTWKRWASAGLCGPWHFDYFRAAFLPAHLDWCI